MTVHPPQTWAIINRPNTPNMMHAIYMLASHLKHHGWTVEMLTEPPEHFTHDMYIVLAAQIFDTLPPDNKRIIYQLEQSTTACSWFTPAYIDAMRYSRAVLDYSLSNFKFLAEQNMVYPRIFYLPIGADPQYLPNVEAVKKTTDILFYGSLSSRRAELLAILQNNFNVHIYSGVYGLDLVKAIRAARLVVNLHYYENALLETFRIQECLSLGVPVVSETAQDQGDYPFLGDAVTFFEVGNADAMVSTVRAKLHAMYYHYDKNKKAILHSATLSQKHFSFMFDRFLIAQNFLEPTSDLS